MPGGWPHSDSPFHRGEQEVQERLGLHEGVDLFARRVIRDFMPDQHRSFFGQLPFLVLGAVDREGRPWASLVSGQPGFVSSPDPRTLQVAARPLFGDPVLGDLAEGMDLGVLGIELETRRRNRATGRVGRMSDAGFDILIDQSFGNCPQYIQTRTVHPLADTDNADRRPVIRSDRFDQRTITLLEKADTFFIATAFRDEKGKPNQGADVSHRGGKPGFVKVEGDRSFVFPDFAGNKHFNTLGNILLNSKTGVLFIDFDSGDLVYMTGEAEVIWDGDLVRNFEGAERMIRFRASVVLRVEHSLPLRFRFEEYSPTLGRTGDWGQAVQSDDDACGRNAYRVFEVAAVEQESQSIKSFLLRPADGGAVEAYRAGQFLPIRVSVPGKDKPVTRTYTLSDAPGKGSYRISVKREGGGAVVSPFLHDHVRDGGRLEVLSPRGSFSLDEQSERPVVLLSAGVGVTPMIAMLNRLVSLSRTCGRSRPVYFIHGARNGREAAFGKHVRGLAEHHDDLIVHYRFSRPDKTDVLGETYDSNGQVDLALLKSLLRFDDYDFYICGPGPFMQSMVDGLKGLGVRDDRINFESFGPSTVKRSSVHEAATINDRRADKPVQVSFATSGVSGEWTPGAGSLLNFAEASGLAPDFGCRSGTCGSCATRLLSGQVHYVTPPTGPVSEGEVLICCAEPLSDPNHNQDGAPGVSLDL